MEVQIEISKEKEFTIEIGYFDTVREIKEKILKYQKIPVAKQTLSFNGQVMVDEGDTKYNEVLHGSRIQLVIDVELEKPIKSVEDSPLSSTVKLEVIVNIPLYNKQFTLELDKTYTFQMLKEKIQEVEPLVQLNLCIIIFNDNGLSDHRSLIDYVIPNYSNVIEIIRSSPRSSVPIGSSTPISKKLKLMVLPNSEQQKILVEVNASETVSDLKKELQILQSQMRFQLPGEGYFFIYKQNVMDDDRSFRWHGVKQGDTIEIFSGSVIGST